MSSPATSSVRVGRRAVILSWSVLTLAWIFLVVPRMNAPSEPALGQTFSFADFRDTVWQPVRDLLSGGVPYDVVPYLRSHPGAQEFLLYVPHYFWVVWPLALVPLKVGAALWIPVLTASVGLLIWLGVRQVGHTLPVLVLLPLSLFIASTPVVNQPLRSGQLAILCALGAAAALSPWLEGRWRVAGAAVALIKPPVGVPLVILLILRRDFRTLFQAGLLVLVLSLPILTLMAVRLGGLGQLADVLLINARYGYSSPVGGTASERGSSTRVDLAGGLWRAGLDLSTVQTATVALLALSTAVITWTVAHSRFGDRHPATLAAAGLVMVVGVPNELYGAVVLVPILVTLLILVGSTAYATWHARAPLPWWPLVVCLLLSVPFVNVHRVHHVLGIPASVSGCLNASSMMICVLMVLCWVTVGRGRIMAGQ